MAYIGTSPTQAVRTRFLYTATASQTTFSGADTQNLTLRYSDANFVDVYQNGVLLKGGGADYTATTTTSVVLATGATADDVIEIIVYDVFAVANLIKKDGDTVEGVINFNGKEITLDADFDTSITSDTDDQIDIKIAGADDFRFTANTFTVLSGSTLVNSGNAIQSNAGITIDNITIDGTEIDLSSGNLTIDVAGGIILDTDAGELQVHDGGTEYVQFKKDSSNVQITAGIQDGDIVFRGNDGGSMIEAMRIDISEGGDLLINKTSSDAGTAGHELLDYGRAVHTANATTVQVVNRLSSDGDIAIFQKDGSTVGSIASSSGDLLIDAPADIILDADGNKIDFQDGGTSIGVFQNSSSDFKIESRVQDKDMIFAGNDGGSGIEAARFDMSAGGFFGLGTEQLGIGISERLTIAGNGTGTNQARIKFSKADSASTGNDFGRIIFNNSANTDLASIGCISLSGNTESGLVFHSGGGNTERMRLDNSGDLAIGSTTPGGLRLFATKAAGENNVAQFTNSTSSGNVFCVGTSINSNGNNTSSFHVRSVTQGVLTAGLLGNGTQTFTSDERLKKNIETTRDGYLEDLAKLRVVKYNWHNHEDGTPKELGLIAQEVEKVFPNLIRTDDDLDLNGVTDPKSLKASVIPMMLLKGLQEATKRIETLEAEVKTLKGE